jgi:outer membrane protein assembly factor BamB
MRGFEPGNSYRTTALGPVWGKPGWQYKPGGGVYVWRPAVAPDGTIYVTTVKFPAVGVDGKLVALHPDGSVKWTTTLTNAAGQGVWASATPVLDAEGNLYVAWAHDKDFKGLTALSLDADGAVRWRYEPAIELENASHQEPVLVNGVLYAAVDTSFYIPDPEHRGSIIALDAASGTKLWRWISPNLDTFFDGPAVGTDGALYHGSAANPLREAHGWLYRILPDGTLDWSVDLGWAGLNAPPALDEENNAYLGDLAGLAFKYSSKGELKWSYDTGSGRIYTSPALSAGRVLLGSAYLGLHVVDAQTGLLLDVYGDGYYPMGKSADAAGNSFYYCYDAPGTVLAFGRNGRAWWDFTTGAGVSVNACIVGRNGLVLVGNSQSLSSFAGYVLGDLNCDGQIDAFDIDPFVLALTDPAGYALKYPQCAIETADVNGDGNVDAFDIDPFVALLTLDTP